MDDTVCGDGIISGDEHCDGKDLGGETCVSLGYTGGTLRCQSSCRYDTKGCEGSPDAYCGNGVLEAGEACDGDDLKDVTCQDLGFAGGTLACTSDCTLSTADCDEGCEATSLPCGYLLSDVIFEAPNTLNGYSCSAYGNGGDLAYRFVAPTNGSVTAWLDCDPFDDLDLYVLEGQCNPQQCVAVGMTVGSEEVTFNVTAGMTYYLVVETYQETMGGYFDLSVSCP